jgi:hypothetical protein
MAVCVYFISKSGDLKKMTLILKEVNGVYIRENLASIIYNITIN